MKSKLKYFFVVLLYMVGFFYIPGIQAQSNNGSLHFRLREMDGNGNLTGRFFNGLTAKLVDSQFKTVYQEVQSKTDNGQDGWVDFDNVPAGNYSVLVYAKNGEYNGQYWGDDGIWRQTGCDGSSQYYTNAMDNYAGDNLVDGIHTPGRQINVPVVAGQITWCRDIGFSSQPPVQRIYFRVREFDQNGLPTGKFVNGATAKLLMGGVTPTQTFTSTTVNGEDGWVLFNNIFSNTLNRPSVMAYKDGYVGFWRETDCSADGTTDQAMYTGNGSDGHVAAISGQIAPNNYAITWCYDVGLKKQ